MKSTTIFLVLATVLFLGVCAKRRGPHRPPPHHGGGKPRPDHGGGRPDHRGGRPDHRGGRPDHGGGRPDHRGHGAGGRPQKPDPEPIVTQPPPEPIVTQPPPEPTPPVPEPPHTCGDYFEDSKAVCDDLYNYPFTQCQGYVDPGDLATGAYSDCISEVCGCFGDGSCACPIYENYAAACTEAGLPLFSWKPDTRYCN